MLIHEGKNMRCRLGHGSQNSNDKFISVHTKKARNIVNFEFHSFYTSTIESINGQLHAPAALPSGKKSPWFLLNSRLCGIQSHAVEY